MTRTIVIHVEKRDGVWLGCMTCSGLEDQYFTYKDEAEVVKKLKAAARLAADLMIDGVVTKIMASHYPPKKVAA